MESPQPQIQYQSPPTIYDSLLDRAHKKAEGTTVGDRPFPRVMYESVRRKKVGSDPKGFIKNTKLMLATRTTAQMQDSASWMVHDPHFKELKESDGNRMPDGKAHQAELLQAMSKLIKSKKLQDVSAPKTQAIPKASSKSPERTESSESESGASKKRKEVTADFGGCVGSVSNVGFNGFNGFTADSKKCQVDGRAIFNHIICGKCFKPLDDGEIPCKYTCSCNM